ncbi:MAG: GxxExxY protein [Fluviicola sp.]
MIKYKSPFKEVQKNISENEIASIVINCAIIVHRELGPGLLETIYERCLIYELEKEGLFIEHQKKIPVNYKGINFELGFRSDLIINKKVIIELKTVETLNSIHLAQILSYLKLTQLKLGIILNFNTNLMKYGIKRVVNELNEN